MHDVYVADLREGGVDKVLKGERTSSFESMRFLRAVTLGYDVGPRVTMAMGGQTFRTESHMSTHAIAGVFGAAAAAAATFSRSRGTRSERYSGCSSPRIASERGTSDWRAPGADRESATA